MPPLSSVRSAQEALLNRTRDLGLGSCAWEAWAFYPRSAKSSTAPTDLRAVPALLLRGRRPAAYTNVLDPLGPVKAYTNVLDPLGPVKARLGLNSPPAPRNTQPRGVRSERTGWLPACAAGAWLRRHPSRGRCPGQRHRAGGGSALWRDGCYYWEEALRLCGLHLNHPSQVRGCCVGLLRGAALLRLRTLMPGPWSH